MTDNRLPIDPDLKARTSVPIKWLQWGLIVVFSLAVLLSGYGGWWYLVASQLRKNISMWVEQQTEKGVSIKFEKMSQKGFPGPIHLLITKPKMLKSGQQGWSWSGDILNLSINPWAVNQLRIDVMGLHQWKLHKLDGVRKYEGSAKKWVGELTLKDGVLDQININLSTLEIKNVNITDSLQVKEADIKVFKISEDAPSFKFRVRGLVLPNNLQTPLGRDVRHVDAKGVFIGRLQLGKWPDFLEAWRDGGGALDFKYLDLDYPPLRVRGDGTVALDSKMQPIGVFGVKVGGVFETVDALYDQGLIPMGTLFATKIVLGMLTKKSVGEDNSYLNIMLTLQDRTLYAGTVQLLKIAPIRW